MKHTHAYSLGALVVLAGTGAAIAVPAPATPGTLTITVANPLAVARPRETVEVALGMAAKLLSELDPKRAVITDSAGVLIPSQLVDIDGDESPDQLVFQTDLAAHERKRFRLAQGIRAPFARGDFKVYGRFVRERHDDFAWENDRVAHRVYGPDLETAAKDPLISSGVDTWVKRVPRLVINDWYMTDDYHRDAGEGGDFYSVGRSRGCGGLGLWAEGRLNVSKNFTRSRVLANGPIRLVFELTYAPWDAGGERVAEVKRFTLDAGSEFNHIETTFSGQQRPLTAGIGIAKHPGAAVKVAPRAATMRVWEPVDGGREGHLGCAIVLPAGTRIEERQTDLDYLVVAPVPAGGRLVYDAGSAWDRAGHVTTVSAWSSEVEQQAQRLSTPIKVTLGK